MNINQFIGTLNFMQFHELFGTMWSKDEGRFLKWELWAGTYRDGIQYAGQHEMLHDFEAQEISWLAKARQLAGSEGAATYAIYLCLKYSNSLVTVFSKDYPAAEAFLAERVKMKLDGMLLVRDPAGNPWPWRDSAGGLPWRTKLDGNCVIDGAVKFFNGSSIEAFSSDNTGPISRSPRLVILDEARTYAKGDAEEIWSGILGALNPPMQVIVISTGKAGTWYNEMTLDIDAGKVPGVKVTFLPDDIRPGHDAEWRVKRLGQLKGNVSRLKREHPLVLKDIFATSEGMVIGSWDKDVHVGELPLEWGPGDEFIIGYDHGHTKTHPAVALFCCYNRYEDFLYVFDEVFVRGRELVEISKEIREKYEFYLRQGAPRVSALADTAIFSDNGVKSIADTLIEETGIAFARAWKHDKDHSTDVMQTRFFHRTIMISPTCQGTIKQVSSWLYKEGKDKPVEIEDDSQDVIRYICMHIEKGPKPVEETVLQKSLRYLAVLDKKGVDEDGEWTNFDLSSVGAGDLERNALC